MPNSAWKIVIVDDNIDDIQIVQTMLEFYAQEVHAVGDARACYDLVERLQPDLVITDLAMPGADGWAVLDAIRSHPQLAHTRVIAMTAYHSDKLAAEISRRGFDGYFPKPIHPDDFIDALRQMMGA